MSKRLRTMAAVGAMMTLTINLWLAAKITATSGRLNRPWPDIRSTALPPMTLVALCVALAFCFIGGLFSLLAQVVDVFQITNGAEAAKLAVAERSGTWFEPRLAAAFERVLETLSRQGALIERIAVPEFLDIGLMNAKGGFAAAESYAWHRYLIASKGNVYDPRVSMRILRGEAISAADYIDLLDARKSLIARATVRFARYDAMVLPTTANTPPRIADLADDKAFTKANLLSLRNCSLINMIDGCAISLPCHRKGEVPVGFMLAASGGSDRRIFELAAAMEGVIRV